MRMRTWIFAVVMALVFAINLGLVSLRIAQTGEETVRARVALASTALKGQLELIDARLSPRAVATNPDLIEATRPPVDPTQPLGKPDERALRAAASVLQPEPDLLIVATAQGAIVSRRAKAAQSLDDANALPLVKSGLEGAPSATFAAIDGALYRVAAARIPGNAAVVVLGMLVDDRMAAQLRSQVDAEVTLLQGGKPVASSLPAEERARVARWAAAPAPGYGVLPVRLPVIGTALSGRLPRGATRYAVRGALVPLDAGVQAALTVSASPYLGWLARYQAFYLLALLAFVLLSFLWGLLARTPAPEVAPAPQRTPQPRQTPAPAVETPGPQPSLDVGNPLAPAAPRAPRDVPWREGEGPSGEHAKLPPTLESLDPEILPLAVTEEPAVGSLPHAGDGKEGSSSLWTGDFFSPTAGQFSVSGAGAALVAAPAEAPTDAPSLFLSARGDEPESSAVFAAPHAPLPPERETGTNDFSFAGLLDEANGSPAPAEPEAGVRPSLSQDFPDNTAPGLPSHELIAQSKPDYRGLGLAGSSEQDYFPGDEPTRIEPVSAALLDKLREKDEPEAGETEALPESAIDAAASRAMPSAEQTMPSADAFAMPPAEDRSMPAADAFAMPPPEETASEAVAASGEHGHAAEHAQDAHEAEFAEQPAQEPPAEAQPAQEAAAAKDVTLSDFSLEGEADRDPDEPHWQQTFDQFRELKEQLGEPADRISFEKFSAKLRKNRADLMAKHSCEGVRFVVYEKDGRAAIKASAIR